MNELDRKLRELAHREALSLPAAYEAEIEQLCGDIRSGVLDRPRRTPCRRGLLLAAIVAAALSVSALAAAGTLSGILDFFQSWSGGLTAEQEAVIQEDTAVLGRSVTDNGVTVTLEEAYGDGNHFFFFLTMDLPEDVDPDIVSFDTIDLELAADGWDSNNFSSSSSNLRRLEESAPAEEEPERFLLRFDYNTYDPLSLPEEGSVPCTLSLKSLVDSTTGGPNGPEVLLSGDWSMTFDLPCDGRSVTMDVTGYTLEGNAALSGEEIQTGELLTLTLRPLGAVLWYVTEPVTGGLDFPLPAVILEDGSEISLRPDGGGHIYEPTHPHGGENYLSYGVDGPILLDQVAAVRFGDLVIPWEPQGGMR